MTTRHLAQALFFLLTVFTTPAFAQTACNATDCPTVGDPYVNNCNAGIDRYLARSISMVGLGDATGSQYCQDIRMCVDLKAAFLRRVAGLWGWESGMIPGAGKHTAFTNAVADINNAYDCAGLRRPIIQSCILEFISPDVNNVPIPQYVLDAFFNDPVEQPYFTGAGYSTWSSYNFNVNNIKHAPAITGFDVPDLAKVEARMWYYYMATQYIDMGYSAIHMGQHGLTAQNDPLNVRVHHLYTMIRNYAVPRTPGFVLLDAHLGEPVYYNSSNQLIYDFLSSPIRPEEEVISQSTNVPCDLGDLNGRLNYNRFVAGMNKRPSLWKGFVPSYDVSPMGCDVDFSPMMFEMDWHNGLCGTFGVPAYNGWCPWGYDEGRWFNTLNDNCQAYWATTATFATKNDLVYRGYFQIPGRYVLQPVPPANVIETYRMYQHGQLVSDIGQIAWKENYYTAFSIDERCGECCIANEKSYTLRVTNPDGSSVYSWHILRPDGSWMPATYGTKRLLCNLQPGDYVIYLRQDNMGFPAWADVIQTHKNLRVTTTECPREGESDGKVMQGDELHQAENDRGNMSISPLKVVPLETTEVKVFPNPSENGLFNISLPEGKGATLQVIDATGRVILRQNIKGGKTTVDIGARAAGIYAVLVTTTDVIHREMITVKQR